MGRKKRYDRETLIERAVDAFRLHGYAGASAERLVHALGVNRSSIYAEFGSKQGLFQAALERYDRENVDRRFAPLEADAAGLAEVRAVFAFYGAASDGPVAGRGCLLCNTAVEFGAHDPTGDGLVQRYFARIRGAFAHALARALARGELREGVDPDAEAAALTATALGMFVMLRAKAPSQVVRQAADAAVRRLDRLSG